MSIDEGVIFGKNKKNKDGLSFRCKKCKHKLKKQYYYSEKGTKNRKQYQQSEKCKKYQKKYGQSKKHKENSKKYKHSKKGKETLKKYLQSETYKEAQKKYLQSKKYEKTFKEYRQSERYKEVKKKYAQSGRRAEVMKKYRQIEKHKISNYLSTAIRRSLKGNKNGRHWEDVVGWTLQQFKRRFAQLFKPEMTWKNHGIVWEIDHIIPLSVHNITSTDCTDFKRAWKLSNLQPLFKEENRSKSNRLKKHFQHTLF